VFIIWRHGAALCAPEVRTRGQVSMAGFFNLSSRWFLDSSFVDELSELDILALQFKGSCFVGYSLRRLSHHPARGWRV